MINEIIIDQINNVNQNAEEQKVVDQKIGFNDFQVNFKQQIQIWSGEKDIQNTQIIKNKFINKEGETKQFIDNLYANEKVKNFDENVQIKISIQKDKQQQKNQINVVLQKQDQKLTNQIYKDRLIKKIKITNVEEDHQKQFVNFQRASINTEYNKIDQQKTLSIKIQQGNKCKNQQQIYIEKSKNQIMKKQSQNNLLKTTEVENNIQIQNDEIVDEEINIIDVEKQLIKHDQLKNEQFIKENKIQNKIKQVLNKQFIYQSNLNSLYVRKQFCQSINNQIIESKPSKQQKMNLQIQDDLFQKNIKITQNTNKHQSDQQSIIPELNLMETINQNITKVLSFIQFNVAEQVFQQINYSQQVAKLHKKHKAQQINVKKSHKEWTLLQSEIQELNTIIYKGTLFVLYSLEWQCIQSAKLSHFALMQTNLKYINKIKIKLIGQIPGTHILKVCKTSGDIIYSVPNEMTSDWFTKIFWAKLVRQGCKMNRSTISSTSICGLIKKKSKIYGWEQRFVSIDFQGLKSSKKIDSLPTVTIINTSQLWTRFQILQDKYVVVKLLRGITKMQFGIPLDSACKWIQAFCSLLR